MVCLETLPEQIAKWNNSIEEVAAQLDEMEQEAKEVIEAMTQFWGSIIQDELLEKLTKNLSQAEG